MTVFYNFSGGMESAAMVWLERERIRETNATIQWANTEKYVGNMLGSVAQISKALDWPIVEVPRRLSWEEFLFERGGMIRKGTTDCSRRMKRSNMKRYMDTFSKPWEVNLGFNYNEEDRADNFTAKNERAWCHWRFPLIEHRVTRAQTWQICREAGFTILVQMYELMGRWDCYFCGNQTPEQARKLHRYFPEQGREWIEMERRKGYPTMPIFQEVLLQPKELPLFPEPKCACFGGDEFFEAVADGD